MSKFPHALVFGLSGASVLLFGIAMLGILIHVSPSARAATIHANTLELTPTVFETTSPIPTEPIPSETFIPTATEILDSIETATPTEIVETETVPPTTPFPSETALLTETWTPSLTPTAMASSLSETVVPTLMQSATIAPTDTPSATRIVLPTKTLLPVRTPSVVPGTIRGRVVLQGRRDAIDVVVRLDGGGEIYRVKEKRAFSVGLAAGTYALVFERGGYLSRVVRDIVVESETTTDLQNIVLWGGDVNQDGLIDESDALQIASHFGQVNDSNAASDINGDGVVNVLDLVLACSNFGRDGWE